jgi:hypothetical protein
MRVLETAASLMEWPALGPSGVVTDNNPGRVPSIKLRAKFALKNFRF